VCLRDACVGSQKWTIVDRALEDRESVASVDVLQRIFRVAEREEVIGRRRQYFIGHMHTPAPGANESHDPF